MVRSWLKKLLLIAFGTILGLVILELRLRIWLSQSGTEEQCLLYLYSRQEINTLAARYEGVAFLNYRLSPNYPQHDSLGYRGPEIAVPKPDGIFRIVALGGSTTYGEFIPDWQNAYPAQLQQVLRETYGYDQIEVVNAGVPGYTSWESLVNFEFRVLDLEPDMIIVYHAINDVNPRLSDPDSYDGLYTGHGFWRVNDEPVPYSALYRFIAVRLFDWQPTISYSLDKQFVTPEGFTGCGLVIEGDNAFCSNLDMTADEVLAANPPIYFDRNIRSIVLLAQARHIQVLLSTWAYSPESFDRPGGDFMTTQFRQDAVAEHNAIIRQIAEDLQAPFVDLAASMPTDKQFWVEGMHPNERGAHEQAEQYAAFMVDAGLLPQDGE